MLFSACTDDVLRMGRMRVDYSRNTRVRLLHVRSITLNERTVYRTRLDRILI